MDFLDSLDLNVSTYKKSRRVRSWYLYEQFKSLERNQLDATRKLKNRSYQDRILRQELSERKVRRKLYDQFGLCQSEHGIESSLKSESTKTSLNVSSDDYFESYHELQEDEGLAKIDVQNMPDACSLDDSQSELYCDDDFRTIHEPEDKNSLNESVKSVANVKSEETVTDNINKYFESKKEDKFDEIEFDFEKVKEKLQCLERMANLKEYDKIPEKDDLYLIEEDEIKQILNDKNLNTSDNNIYIMWSKLVSFAYQIMQLNHGNCYYDYGSQFLTAVLACDVLRRGINRMCYILQPYVSPINYATDSGSSVVSLKKVKRKNPQRSKQSRRSHNYKRYFPKHNKPKRRNFQATRRFRSENFWEEHSLPFSLKKYINEKNDRGASEPWRSLHNKENSTSKSSYNTIWPTFSSDTNESLNKMEHGRHNVVVINPMLGLSRYLDNIMRNIDDHSIA